MKRQWILGFVFAFAASWGWAEEGAEFPVHNYPPVPAAKTVGHRGFSAAAPENTLASIWGAIRVHADGCEMDVRQTQDGFLFLSHDGNLKRATGRDIETSQITFQELRTLDAGSWKGDTFQGEQIPTLEEALLLLKGTQTRPIIEVKEDGFEEKLVRLLRRYDLAETAVIIDFSAARVKKIRELAPEICVAWLCNVDQKLSTDEIVSQISETLRDSKTNVVDMQFSPVTPELVEKLHRRGIYVWVWTVDQPEDIARLLDCGVDSITSNRPDLVHQAREEKRIR